MLISIGEITREGHKAIFNKNALRVELKKGDLFMVEWSRGMVIIKRCEMLGADQSRMIRNILERGRARVVLDKVVAQKEGGGLEVIDEPEQIKQRVRQHFQEWNAHRVLGTSTDRWDRVYAPREDINTVWYDGVVIAVEEEELDEVL